MLKIINIIVNKSNNSIKFELLSNLISKLVKKESLNKLEDKIISINKLINTTNKRVNNLKNVLI